MSFFSIPRVDQSRTADISLPNEERDLPDSFERPTGRVDRVVQATRVVFVQIQNGRSVLHGSLPRELLDRLRDHRGTMLPPRSS